MSYFSYKLSNILYAYLALLWNKYLSPSYFYPKIENILFKYSYFLFLYSFGGSFNSDY